MKVDTKSQPESELALQPREKVLWESGGGPDKFEPIAWTFILFWTLFFIILAGILVSLLLETLSSTNSGWQPLFIVGGLVIAAMALTFLSKQIYRELNGEKKMNYAITNQRLVAANSSGAHHQSFTGRPFSSLEMSHKGDVHDIILRGVGMDREEVVVQLTGVKDGAAAEKLLLKSFMQKSGAKT